VSNETKTENNFQRLILSLQGEFGQQKHFLVHIMVNDTCMMGKYDQVQKVEADKTRTSWIRRCSSSKRMIALP